MKQYFTVMFEMVLVIAKWNLQQGKSLGVIGKTSLS